ncbi:MULTISPECIES: phospho-sugar mutase [unclassified Microbacterium]|uniref:phospho-sugar mutase n=1 Tax=unclassified Microbacterium TaxID=2609290 RepID=UPI00214C28B0|nr:MULTISPECIES: phospho-sugar mutase [unclassified Microbacterium]MCR2785190.1 phospho-sugar mutase [Microbacterium sp. zg.B96]MDL5352552.1 phospho-sugar mutase [Microbacterium sp. zg-YB36]WIM16723.1 phospho-sugar mutase [Microbacterium sp. zg-B96]
MIDATAAARTWLAQDPDPVTRAELEQLLAAADAGDAAAAADLTDRFATRLAFGTAGLRGRLGAGSNRMNRMLVMQAAAGLAAYLLEKPGPDGPPTVVIGYDGRRNSDVFARDSAEVFAGAGLRAILLPRLLPTPVLAFAVRHLGADAGVMVTASHNPPDDNGYKVYLGGADDGAQIVPPADAEIAAHIQRVADAGDLGSLPRSPGYETASEAVVEAYIAATAAVSPAPDGTPDMTWVYTAMHGVGWETLSRILQRAGYPAPAVVTAQIEPDGTFPTVAFPNPEEPGAMDLAFQTAREVGAEFILANDPDADRLAVAVPDADVAGGWRALTGNEVGLLLGWRAARLAADARAGREASLACSLVSSPGLAVVAERYGLSSHATLTGFKWISRAPGIVYGFEEALGYLVNPETVRDKDGISAAVAMLGLVAEARRRGATAAQLLTEFQAEFGFFTSAQVSLRVQDVAVIGRIMARLRAEPPLTVGAVAVERIDDLQGGIDDLPPADVLRLWLVDGSRVIVRPSGTEPKLKAYLDVRGESAADARARLTALEAGARELVAAP